MISYCNLTTQDRYALILIAGQSQLLLVGADGMQVGAADCRFIRSYLWFEIGAGRS